MSILLLEDDEVEVRIVRRSFEKAGVEHAMVLARDGVEALEVLRGENGREKIEAPFLILVDINMPRMNGHEFIEELRADPNLGSSVVFVLTTSEHVMDKDRAYRNHVAGYIVKSTIGDGMSGVVDLLGKFWQTVEMPQN
ncbi:MAG: response regulator [Planctomycetes bacterium]|nr:response regulator [Planctomycetota bacterium]